MEPIIAAKDLQKHYPMGEVVVEALRGLNLTVRPGEFVAIMGPSGSGKSTLLHLLGGLEVASSGEVRLRQQSLSALGERDLTLMRRRKIGVVFQFFNLLPTMTAEENVALPLLLDGRPARETSARAAEALGWVGLAERRRHTPDRLSGGEQQRVALARALITRPDVVLADEPTGNLDSASGEQVLDLLRRACLEKGQTVLMVTHDPAAAARTDRVVFLRDGRVIDEVRGPGLTPEAIVHAQARLKD
ncbi:MAG TPA: ABC transporter ATP-binding protein [Anaerolineales bacterium]|nr:ABC transporter ATP-binding protein [Anaerolineales bacterium]